MTAQPRMGVLVLLGATSGVLLAPLAYVVAASGLCILYPELAWILTLGAIDNPALCLRLHTSPLLQAATIIVGSVHVYSTAELLAARTIDAPVVVRLLRTVYRGLVLVLATLVSVIAILHYFY